MNRQELLGKQADVISGPHQGRGGFIKQFRDIAMPGVNDGEAETYVVIEYSEKNCFDEVQTDHIAVPVRRVALR